MKEPSKIQEKTTKKEVSKSNATKNSKGSQALFVITPQELQTEKGLKLALSLIASGTTFNKRLPGRVSASDRIKALTLLAGMIGVDTGEAAPVNFNSSQSLLRKIKAMVADEPTKPKLVKKKPKTA